MPRLEIEHAPNWPFAQRQSHERLIVVQGESCKSRVCNILLESETVRPLVWISGLGPRGELLHEGFILRGKVDLRVSLILCKSRTSAQWELHGLQR